MYHVGIRKYTYIIADKIATTRKQIYKKRWSCTITFDYSKRSRKKGLGNKNKINVIQLSIHPCRERKDNYKR